MTVPGSLSFAIVSVAPSGVASRAELREPEVEDLRVARGVDHHVLGLEIPVHDPERVGRGQPFCHLRGDLQALAEVEGAAVEKGAERHAVDQLHRDVMHRLPAVGGALLTDVVDGDDVRVTEIRGRAGLLHEAINARRVANDLGRQNFERDAALEGRVPGLVDLSHPALSQQRDEAVATENLRIRHAVPAMIRNES